MRAGCVRLFRSRCISSSGFWFTGAPLILIAIIQHQVCGNPCWIQELFLPFFDRDRHLPRPPLSNVLTTSQGTGAVPIEVEGEDAHLSQAAFRSDDQETQADPVVLTHLGVGGLSEDEHVVAEGPIDENAEMTHVARRGWVETCERSLRCVCI